MENKRFDMLPNPVILYNEHWEIVSLNRAALRALEYSDDSELNDADAFSVIHKKDHSKIEQIEEELSKKSTDATRKPICHLKKTGEMVCFMAQFGKVQESADGKYAGYIESAIIEEDALVFDSCGKPTLEDLEILAENIPGLEMFLVDKNQQVLCKLGDETHREGWVLNTKEQSDILAFFPQKEQDTLSSLLRVAFESTPVSSEIAVNGDYFSIRIVPLNQKDQEARCVVILQKITDIKIAENKLKHSKEKAEEASQAKDRFVAKMSHEIRTPLNAVIGFTDQLHQTRLTKKQTNYLNVIDNASQHLLSMVDDILVLSKIESEQIVIEEIPFTVPQVLKAVNQVLEHQSKEKQLVFQTSFESTLEKYLVGDPAKLRQVLINLAGNAIKFTHKGSVSLKSSLVEQTRKTATVRFEVADTGIGISPEDIVRIFKPFHQVDNRLDRSFTGCGLGLAISKDLIKAMGGKLEVESTPGKGTTFFFTLSFVKGKNRSDTADDVFNTTIALDRIRVLFVDDDPVNRMLGSIILKKNKIKTDFAETGKEAIDMFKPGKYDLIFLDINLPDINGEKVAGFIREKEKYVRTSHQTKLIAMTANALRSQLRRYLRAGMNSVLLKPYKEETLVKTLLSLLPGQNQRGIHADKSAPQRIKKQEYDLSQLEQITKGDPDFLQLMLNSFIENSEQLLEKIETDFSRDDYAGIAEAAHRLYPSMEQLGVIKAATLLKKVEQKYLRKQEYSKDPKLIRNTIHEIQKGISAIREVLNTRFDKGSVS